MNSNAPSLSTGGFEVLEIPVDQYHSGYTSPCQCVNCNPQIQAMPAFFEYYEAASSSKMDRITTKDKMVLATIFVLSMITCGFVMRKYK